METIHRAYKTKLVTNNVERTTFRRYAGAARFVYNWALADRIEKYKAGNPTNLYEQKRRFNATKDEFCPWIREIPYTVTESAFCNLDTAYQNFFRRVKQGAAKAGFPKFKSRYDRQSFTVRGVVIEDARVRLPVLGWVRLAEKEYLPAGRYPTSAMTISEDAGEWYASIQVEVPRPEPQPHVGVIGIDRGIKSLAVCSDGTTFDNSRVTAKYEKKLARLNRELSRRKKGSANRAKTKEKLNKLHAQIRREREHTLHNISRYVTINTMPEVVVLEDLNVKGMTHNRHLSKAVADAAMGELGRQIEYKADWHDIKVVKVDMWFPSSKTCSRCGCIRDELLLSERTFVCPDCGFTIDRDLNAARNLAAMGEPVSNGGLPVELGCDNASL